MVAPVAPHDIKVEISQNISCHIKVIDYHSAMIINYHSHNTSAKSFSLWNIVFYIFHSLSCARGVKKWYDLIWYYRSDCIGLKYDAAVNIPCIFMWHKQFLFPPRNRSLRRGTSRSRESLFQFKTHLSSRLALLICQLDWCGLVQNKSSLISLLVFTEWREKQDSQVQQVSPCFLTQFFVHFKHCQWWEKSLCLCFSPNLLWNLNALQGFPFTR